AVSGVHTETFNNPINIGYTISNPNGESHFIGQIDEVEIFSRALSQTEIQAIFNADNAGKCSINISGAVTYAITPANQTAKLVPGVTLTIVPAATPASILTNLGGSYSFNNLTAGGSYTVSPTKTGGANGITAFDATLVLRHVAANGQGANALNQNQQKAADADGDGFVTAFDATLILRYVAANGANANTGQTGSWKFLPPTRSYSALNGRNSNQNYEAILIGDIDGDWVPTNSLQGGDEGMNEDQKLFAKPKIN
ncbi:MAG: dockerin type I domain-containing protein, partial [Acidobacteriota bacterium]|nr:dockerin type I domain-containing protein [Acidobacteriota bacterium]